MKVLSSFLALMRIGLISREDATSEMLVCEATSQFSQCSPKSSLGEGGKMSQLSLPLLHSLLTCLTGCFVSKADLLLERHLQSVRQHP